jgi:hypothetical protein
LLTIGGLGSAFASHYRLTVLDFLAPELVTVLGGQDIENTEDFLRRTLTPEDRGALSEATGIPEVEILELARMCEVLQIEGVGPRVARLLRASGVVSVTDFASRDATELEAVFAAVNAVEHHTGINPSAENLAEWIDLAGRVEYHIR